MFVGAEADVDKVDEEEDASGFAASSALGLDDAAIEPPSLARRL